VTGPIVFLVLLAILVLIGVVALVHWMIARRRAAARPIPPIFFPMGPTGPSDTLGKADPQWGRRTSAPDGARPATPPAAAGPVAPPPPASPQTPPGQHVPVPPVRSFTPAPSRNGNNGHHRMPVVDGIDDGTPVSTETVRFVRPAEQAVQLLPGRLEVVAGDTSHQEIRFVRIPGQPPELILGRDGGPSAQYVGLSSATVSRRHAHFLFVDGRWVVRNLSKTNPLVVNDDELSDTAGQRELADGDRLELGEVVLRFHAH
jgi:hypothetical protein